MSNFFDGMAEIICEHFEAETTSFQAAAAADTIFADSILISSSFYGTSMLKMFNFPEKPKVDKNGQYLLNI